MSEAAQEATNDEGFVDETEDDGTESAATLDDVDDPKTLKKLIRSLRNENKNARLKSKERDAKLAEYDEWKRSQQTELERAQNAVAEREKRLEAVLRQNYALKYNVPEDLQEFITGSEDEMEKRAKKLGRDADGAMDEDVTSSKTYMFGGNRGSSVGKRNGDRENVSGNSEADWFAKFYENGGRAG